MKSRRRFFAFVALSCFIFPSFAQLTADFSANKLSGCGSLSGVSFTDQSSGNPTSWQWDFGNGNSSTLQNPSANYTAPGKYTVQLIAANATSRDTMVKTDLIVVHKRPTASYTFTPNTGCSPLKVNFTDQSTIGDTSIKTYVWDFGDGNTSGLANPVHTFNGGNFTHSLQIIDHNGCSDFITQPITVFNSPIVDFSAKGETKVCSDTLTVEFVNNSVGNNLQYLWDFGDGNSSTQKEPLHFYNGFGNYTVKLTVSNSNCSTSTSRKNFVRLTDLKVDFSVEKKGYCLGDTVKFTGQSAGATLFRWNFGDSSNSTSQNPKKVYQDSGFFEVELIVSAGSGCVTSTKDTIHVQQAVADFVTSPDFICQQDDTTFFKNRSINVDTSIWKIPPFDLDTFELDTVLFPKKNFSLNYNDLGDEFEDSIYDDTLIVISKRGCRDTLGKAQNREIKEFYLKITQEDTLKSGFEDDLKRKIQGGCMPLICDFKALTSYPNDTDSIRWDFNGISSTSLDLPPITINDDSLRKVTLWGKIKEGCSFTDSVLVQAGNQQVPDILWDKDSLCFLDTIRFTDSSNDQSKINSSTLELIFGQNGSGTPIDFIYENSLSPGWVSLKYTVGNNGCDSTIFKNRAFLSLGPFAQVTGFSPSNCSNPRLVQLFSNLDEVTDFVWDFGDGSPLDSTNPNPLHLFPNNATYVVRLKAFNDSTGCDTMESKFVVKTDFFIPPPIRYASKNYCLNDSIIVAASPFQLDSMSWLINDKLVATDEDSIKFAFEKVGFNTIELRVRSLLGCRDTIIDSIYVSHLELAFKIDTLSPCLPFKAVLYDASTSDTTISKWFWKIKKDTFNTDTVNLNLNTIGKRNLSFEVENVLGCKGSIKIKDYIEVKDFEVSFALDFNRICVGDTVTFRNLSQGEEGLVFNWSFGDGSSLLSQDEFVGHRYIAPGNYTVTLKAVASNGCEKIERKVDHVIVESKPAADFTADTTQADCFPFAVNFSDRSQGSIDQWDWRFGNGGSSELQNPFVNYTSVGKFDVFLKVTSPNGCADSILKTDFIRTGGPDAEFSISKDSLCINEPLQFEILSKEDVASFLWDFGDGAVDSGEVASHAYSRTGKIFPSLILRDSSGSCTVVLRDSVFVFEVEADFSVEPDTACAPFQANFTNQSSGANAFLWRFPDGTTNNNDNNPALLFDQAGSFEVSLEVTSDINCRDEVTKTILVHPKPLADVSNNISICAGDTTVLQATGGVEYRWSPNQNLSSDRGASVLAYPDSTTLYRLIVINDENCRDTASVLVEVQQAPLDFNLIDTNIIIGEELVLDAFAGEGFTYQWTPSEGLSCDDCPRPRAQPLSSVKYQVLVKDQTGCFEFRKDIFIEVKEIFTLDVPTAFSPNGDGINDVIFARGAGLKALIAFKIYNRFGELVFESNDFDRGWDGTYRGQDQNIETYIYTVEALTFSNRILTKKGNISLLR